jgi:hypothetical protein
MCTGNLGQVYSLSALGSHFQADRVRRADVVANFEISEVEVAGVGPTFMCPISYEEETDIVLLVAKPRVGLLSGEPRDVVNTIITNPLAALRYPGFCRKLIAHIDHPVSLKSMKDAQLAGYPVNTSPMTRAPVIGGFCLAASEDHARATDSVMAHLVSEGKRVGNADLWFVLAWRLLEDNRVPYLAEILPQVREHLVFRLKKHFGTFTLTNVPYLPVTLVPMGIAFWTTICAIAYASEEKAMTYLKCHSGHIPVIVKAVTLLGYPIPEVARAFVRRYLTFSAIRQLITTGDADVVSWAIRATYTVRAIDTTKVDPTRFKYVVSAIPVDGPEPPADQVAEALTHLPKWFADLTPAERRSAVKLMEVHNIGQIAMTDLAKTIEPVNWQYGLRDYDLPEVPICPATCRPFQIIASRGEWYQASESVFGDVKHQIHAHKYFIEFVKKYRAYPAKDEFLLFMFHDIVPKHKATLPKMVVEFAEVVLRGYTEIAATIYVPEFMRISARSERLVYRKELEREWRAMEEQRRRTLSDSAS